MQIPVAILFTQSEDARFPVQEILNAELANDGNIWFIISRPRKKVDGFEVPFSAGLRIYIKEKKRLLHIAGIVSKISHTDQPCVNLGLSDVILSAISNSKYLVMKMDTADLDLTKKNRISN